MSYGVLYGQNGVNKIPLSRTILPIASVDASSGVAAGVAPNSFTVAELGYHQVDFDLNMSSPTNDTSFTLQLWNLTTDSLIQSRRMTAPQQSWASDMYCGFEWQVTDVLHEYAFYIVPNISIALTGFCLLLQDLNFRAVVQEFGGAGVGPGTVNRIAKFTGPGSIGDSIMSEAATVITVAGSVNLANTNTDTFLSFTDGQNVPVSAANTGRIRYNTATQTFQFSENGGAWADLSGVGPGTINRIAKFNAIDTVDDSIMSEAATVITVAGSVNLANTNTDTFLSFTDGQNVPVSAANTGRIRYNTAAQTFQFSENGGAWVDLSSVGPGTINYVAKFTAVDAVGNAQMTDDGAGAFTLRDGTNQVLAFGTVAAAFSVAETAGVDVTIRARDANTAGAANLNGGSLIFQTGAPTGTGTRGSVTCNTRTLGVVQAVATGGSPNAFSVAAGAHTTLAAGTECIDVNVNLARTVQFATGAIATQRAFVIQAPTYAAVAASTITSAATLAITNAPQAGVNVAITNAYALWVQAGRTKLDGVTEVAQVIEKLNAKGDCTGNQTFNLQDGNVITAKLTGDGIWTITNPAPSGKSTTVTFILTNMGAFTVTWAVVPKWAGGVAPVWTAAGVDVLVLTTVDGGVTWYGSATLNLS